MSRPWWLQLEGGDEAAEIVKNLDSSPILQSAWIMQNETDLGRNPEVAAAAIASGMPGPYLKRLDNSIRNASKAKQWAGLEQAENIHLPSYVRQAMVRNGSDASRAFMREAQKRQAETDAAVTSGMLPDMSAAGELQTLDQQRAFDQAQEEDDSDEPWWSQTAHGIWDAGKSAWQGLLTGAQAIGSVVDAPMAAGSAARENQDVTLRAENFAGPGDPLQQLVRGLGPAILQSGKDFLSGVGSLTGLTDLDSQQKQDMIAGGYDPESFTDRWGWYTDLNSPHDRVSNKRVNELKQRHNPYKVDLVRHLVASGVFQEESYVDALDPEAQKLYQKLARGGDEEAAKIAGKLLGKSFGPGSNLADTIHESLGHYGVDSDRDSGKYTAVEVAGDLAAYWYIDPGVVLGKGAKAWRAMRWATDANPDAVKDFIINSKAGSKHWDDALDMVDRAHVLTQKAEPEALVQAARVGDEFRTKFKDMAPMWEHLLQLRNGSVTGAVFRTDMDKAVAKGKADFLSNSIALERVDDVAKRKPVFALRNAPDEEVSQATRDLARREVADRLGDMIFAMQVAKGDPLLRKGKMLMPGMYRLSRPVRAMTKPFTERAFSREGLLFKQLDEAKGKGIIDFSAIGAGRVEDALGGVIDSAQGGKWVYDNFTRGGLRSKIARASKKFDMIEDAAVLRLEGVDTSKQFYEYVRTFLPRGQASFLAHRWAVADPGTRSVMKRRLFEMQADALGVRSTKAASDLFDNLLDEAFDTAAGVRRKASTQLYGARSVNEIDTPAGSMPAALYSTQFADGAQLPAMLEIARNTERTGILSMILGVNHGRFADQIQRANKTTVKASRAIKQGWIGTLSNMMRQRLEGRELLQLLDDPASYVSTTLARAGIAGQTAATRVAVNQSVRQAKKLINKGAWRELAGYHGRGRTDEYVAAAQRMLGEDLHPWLRASMLENAPLDEIAKTRGTARLAASGAFVDPLRKVRAARYKKLGEKYDPTRAPVWAETVDRRFADELAENVRRTIGHDRDHYVDGAMADEIRQVDDIISTGDKVVATRLSNQWDYLDSVGESGAQRWATAKAFADNDPIGREVGRAVAAATLARVSRGKKAANWLSDTKIALRERFPSLRGEVARINTPEDYAYFLLKHTPEGMTYRTNGRRAMLQGGKFIPDVDARDGALRNWAEAMVEDTATMLGLRSDGFQSALTRGETPDEVIRLLDKQAKGKTPDLSDLRAVPEDLRPHEFGSRVIVGKRAVETSGAMDKLGGMTAKWYRSVVARPLHDMVSSPVMLASHREVMDAMEPVARRLMDKGMSSQSVYNHMQNLAWGHALARNYRYMDNPKHQSYFASLFNNYLWFERAAEDFVRRAWRVTKADPSIIARHALMVEASVHSGLVHEARVDDGEGNSSTELVFQWPGSGLAMRAINESLGRLGIQDRVVTPVWQDLRSPVRYLSPSLQNPVGFTTSPLIGLPVRALRDNFFPEHAPQIDAALSSMEGGERYFASQEWWQTLMPAYARRIFGVLDQDGQTSQLQSATTNALMQYHAAGLLPGEDATRTERAMARDDIATMSLNNLIFRQLFAAWAPAAPQSIYSNVNDIGDEDLNIVDRERGIETVRGAWFALLEDMTQKHGADKAFAEASAEWFKRGNKSIINPEAYLVGSTGEPGDETGKSFASGMQTATWMVENTKFLKEYGDVAYSLLPSFNEQYYDAIGYRLQLRNDLRQRKSPQEMYESLLFASGERDFYKYLDIRDKAIERGIERDRAQNWFDLKVSALEGANPVWSGLKSERSSARYIAENVAPSVRKLADTKPDALPKEIRTHQDDIRVMADLYDEYQSELEKATTSGGRIGLAIRYGQIGDSLFKDGPIHDLWIRMRVWED